MMNRNETINIAKQLISENKIDETLLILKNYISQTGTAKSDFAKSVILLSSDYKDTVSHMNSGLLNYEEHNIRLGQLKNRLLNIIDNIENERKNPLLNNQQFLALGEALNNSYSHITNKLLETDAKINQLSNKIRENEYKQAGIIQSDELNKLKQENEHLKQELELYKLNYKSLKREYSLLQEHNKQADILIGIFKKRDNEIEKLEIKNRKLLFEIETLERKNKKQHKNVNKLHNQSMTNIKTMENNFIESKKQLSNYKDRIKLLENKLKKKSNTDILKYVTIGLLTLSLLLILFLK